MKIGRVSYYHWNSYRCQRELRESIMQYVKKYWTELWTRNRSRREPGDDGRVGPDISWQDRQEREAPAEPVSEVTVYTTAIHTVAPLKTDTE